MLVDPRKRRRFRDPQKEYECGSEAHKADTIVAQCEAVVGIRGVTDQEVSLVAVCVSIGKIPGRIA